MKNARAPHRLEARALQCSLHGRPILAPCTFTLEPGITAILGPNGSGKSTLLRMLAGLEPAPMQVQGSVNFAGTALGDINRSARAAAITWLGQGASSESGQADTSGLNVEGLVRLSGMARRGWWHGQAPAGDLLVQQALNDFELQALSGTSLTDISGGERQRAQLARAFATGSPVLLLDEPDNHLDLRHLTRLRALMRARASAGHILACSTHDLNAALSADRLLVLHQGSLALNVRLDEITDAALCTALSEVFASPLQLLRHEGRRLFVQP